MDIALARNRFAVGQGFVRKAQSLEITFIAQKRGFVDGSFAVALPDLQPETQTRQRIKQNVFIGHGMTHGIRSHHAQTVVMRDALDALPHGAIARVPVMHGFKKNARAKDAFQFAKDTTHLDRFALPHECSNISHSKQTVAAFAQIFKAKLRIQSLAVRVRENVAQVGIARVVGGQQNQADSVDDNARAIDCF